MLRATQHIRRMRGEAQAHLMRANDGQYYVVKFQNNPQHIRVLANELLAFDKWVCNSDRRQALFYRLAGKYTYTLTFIDHGHCFNVGEWNFPDSPLLGVYVWNAVYAGVSRWRSFEPWLARIERLDPRI